jgi:poly(A) polymerase
MDGVDQPPEHHPEGDVLTHVTLMLNMAREPPATLAWGILLHDVGKPCTFSRSDRIRFNGHDAVGAEMAADICARLRMSNAERSRVVDLVANHMRIGAAKLMRASKLKRLLREPYFPELLELHRLDCMASHGKQDLFEFCREALRSTPDDSLRPAPLINGDELIALGYEPGPSFKAMLALVEEEQLEGRLSTREAAIELLRARYPVGDADPQ